MTKPTEEEMLLAVLAVGFAPQLRYYGLMRDLGHEWAAPVYDKFRIMHDRNIADLYAYVEGMKR